MTHGPGYIVGAIISKRGGDMAKQETRKRMAIKRINERYTDICREFGPDSSIAKDFEKSLLTVFGPENMHKATKPGDSTRDPDKKLTAGDMGISLISRNKKVYDSVDMQTLDTLLRRQTAGQIKKDIAREAKEEGVTKEDVLSAMDYIYDLDDDNPEFYEAVKFYWEEVAPGRKPDGKGKKPPTFQNRPSYSFILELMNGQAEVNRLKGSKQSEKAADVEKELRYRVQQHRVEVNPFEVLF